MCLKKGYLLSILEEKQNNRIICNKDLENLSNSLHNFGGDLRDYDIYYIIYILFRNVKIRWVDEYIISKQIFKYTIKNIDKILDNSEDKSKVIYGLEKILSIAASNSVKIYFLEIEDKFNSTLDFYQERYEKENQNKKIKQI